MPSYDEHRRRYVENLAHIGELEQLANRNFGWEVVAHFYTCLHAVDMVLAQARPDVHPDDHAQRRNAILHNSLVKPAISAYNELERLSRVARYDANLTISEANLAGAQRYANTVRNTVRRSYRDLP